jgi:hypothetical protein
VRLTAAIPLAAAFAIAAVVAFGGARDGTDRRPATERVPPGELLQRTYMGVSCPRPNSISCDRVGLAVWLREEASAVVAEIDGRRFRLDDPEWMSWPNAFAGFLQPAGLRDGELRVPVASGRDRWLGYGHVSARVRLHVTGGGRVRVTELDVPLHAGWG